VARADLSCRHEIASVCLRRSRARSAVCRRFSYPPGVPRPRRSFPTRRSSDLSAIPAVTVVARTGPDELDAWAARWRGDKAVRAVEPAEAVAPNLSTVDITLAVPEQGDAARDLVRRIRADRPAAESWVTGNAAALLDMSELLLRGMPWA